MAMVISKNNCGCWGCGGFRMNDEKMTKWCYTGCCYFSETGLRREMSPCICSSSTTSEKFCCWGFGSKTWNASGTLDCCSLFPCGIYTKTKRSEEIHTCWLFGCYDWSKTTENTSDVLRTFHPCGTYQCDNQFKTSTCCYTWGLGCLCDQKNEDGKISRCWLCALPPLAIRRGRCCEKTRGCCSDDRAVCFCYGCCCEYCPCYINHGKVDTNEHVSTTITLMPIGEIEYYPRYLQKSTETPTMGSAPPPEFIGYGTAVRGVCCNYET